MHTYLLTVPRSWQLEREIELLRCDATPIRYNGPANISKHQTGTIMMTSRCLEYPFDHRWVFLSLLIVGLVGFSYLYFLIHDPSSSFYFKTGPNPTSWRLTTGVCCILEPCLRETFDLGPSYCPSVRRERGLHHLVCCKDLEEYEVNELSI